VAGTVSVALHGLLHALALFLLPPLLLGVIVKTKAAFAGRVGAPLLQPYRDLAKLLGKGSVFSRTTTWVFRAGPVVSLVAVAAAAVLVPLGSRPALVSFEGDFVLFAYLLGLGRFFTVLAALDTGSAFEGMGAAREATFAALAEPAFFLGLLVLVVTSGDLSLSGMLGDSLTRSWTTAGASLVLVLFCLFIVLLAENSRIPVDDPGTHLELTMIHEVMVLDHGGPALGLILYGAALKLFLFVVILARLVVPVAWASAWWNWAFVLVSSLAIAAAIGVVESTMARLRLTHVPRLLIAACLLSAVGIVLLVR
jgi:formate hydrogenlyase subunit 4